MNNMTNKKIRLGIDIDDVLRDFELSFRKVLEVFYPGKYIEHKIPTWTFDHIDLPYDKIKDIMYYEHANEILLDAPMCNDALEGIKRLNALRDSHGLELVCVSNQPEHVIPLTLQWLGNHKFNFKEIIFTDNKTAVNIDYLIDDSSKNYDDWIASGRSKNSYILVNKSYNIQLYHNIRIDSIAETEKICNYIFK